MSSFHLASPIGFNRETEVILLTPEDAWAGLATDRTTQADYEKITRGTQTGV